MKQSCLPLAHARRHLRCREAVACRTTRGKTEYLTLKNTRIGSGAETSGGRNREISGDEMRRANTGLELFVSPDASILDEPTSARNYIRPSTPSSFSPKDTLYTPDLAPSFPSTTWPTRVRMSRGINRVQRCRLSSRAIKEGPSQLGYWQWEQKRETYPRTSSSRWTCEQRGDVTFESGSRVSGRPKLRYATTFLTQLEYLLGGEWRILRRDESLFLTYVAAAAVLSGFCGGLYYQTDETIAGFQSRVGRLSFLGALIAFSSLSALYNNERSSGYYSPTTWLFTRFVFDIIPLRIMPTISLYHNVPDGRSFTQRGELL
ncbi:hypothetical protein PM082_024614 [Marasmius tenuissimus]|nr:hypothetical protein PM082_024614 [Marasmius tenuissimus]